MYCYTYADVRNALEKVIAKTDTIYSRRSTLTVENGPASVYMYWFGHHGRRNYGVSPGNVPGIVLIEELEGLGWPDSRTDKYNTLEEAMDALTARLVMES
jgi:hypothetical protein